MSQTTPTAAPPLDEPHYGIGFLAAIKRAFKKYADFNGRASRGEFWFWYLFYVIGASVLAGLGGGLGVATSPDGGQTFGALGIIFFVLFGLFILAIIVPTLAVGARRLHDAGFSALFLLFLLASSFGGGIVLIILWALPTSPKAVRYGPPGQPDAISPYGAGYGYPPAAGYSPDPQAYGAGAGYAPAPQSYGADPQGYAPVPQGYPDQGYPAAQGYPAEGYPADQGYPTDQSYPTDQGYPHDAGHQQHQAYPVDDRPADPGTSTPPPSGYSTPTSDSDPNPYRQPPSSS